MILKGTIVSVSRMHSCVAFLQYARISLKPLIPKPYDFEPKTLGEHLLKRRLFLKLSQPKLAKLLGVSTETILNWELDYKKPSINHIGKLIQFFGMGEDIIDKEMKRQWNERHGK